MTLKIDLARKNQPLPLDSLKKRYKLSIMPFSQTIRNHSVYRWMVNESILWDDDATSSSSSHRSRWSWVYTTIPPRATASMHNYILGWRSLSPVTMHHKMDRIYVHLPFCLVWGPNLKRGPRVQALRRVCGTGRSTNVCSGPRAQGMEFRAIPTKWLLCTLVQASGLLRSHLKDVWLTETLRRIEGSVCQLYRQGTLSSLSGDAAGVLGYLLVRTSLPGRDAVVFSRRLMCIIYDNDVTPRRRAKVILV